MAVTSQAPDWQFPAPHSAEVLPQLHATDNNMVSPRFPLTRQLEGDWTYTPAFEQQLPHCPPHFRLWNCVPHCPLKL